MIFSCLRYKHAFKIVFKDPNPFMSYCNKTHKQKPFRQLGLTLINSNQQNHQNQQKSTKQPIQVQDGFTNTYLPFYNLDKVNPPIGLMCFPI